MVLKLETSSDETIIPETGLTDMELEQIYRENYNRLLLFAARLTRNTVILPEDLLHDCILKAIKYKDSFQKNRPAIRWLRAIMYNTFITNIKDHKKRQETSLDFLDMTPDKTVALDSNKIITLFDQPEFLDDYQRIKNDIDSLAESDLDTAQRCDRVDTLILYFVRLYFPRLTKSYEKESPLLPSFLILADIFEYDYEEIASLLRVKLGTVKSRISRIKASLRTDPAIIQMKSVANELNPS